MKEDIKIFKVCRLSFDFLVATARWILLERLGVVAMISWKEKKLHILIRFRDIVIRCFVYLSKLYDLNIQFFGVILEKKNKKWYFRESFGFKCQLNVGVFFWTTTHIPHGERAKRTKIKLHNKDLYFLIFSHVHSRVFWHMID